MLDSFWQAALAVGGLAAVGAFLFWSLYKGWLRLGIFAQLTTRQTFVLMMTFLVLSFSALVSILVVYVKNDRPGPSGQPPKLELKGSLDIRDPTVDESEVAIGLYWGIEDDRYYYWTDGELSGANFTVTIAMAEPPEDALMLISAVNSTTSGQQELLRLGVAFVIAYRDQNHTGLFDRGDELLGGCPTHVVTFRDGPLPRDLGWNLPEGYSVAEAISPEERGLESGFDILRSVQSSTRLSVIVPQSREDIRYPNWT